MKKVNTFLHPRHTSILLLGSLWMFLSVFFLSSEITYAASSTSSCALKSGPGNSLKQYFSSLDKELNALKSASNKYSCTSSDGTNGTRGEIKSDAEQLEYSFKQVKYINSGIQVDNPWITGRFWFEGMGERPYEVTRDLKLLSSKQKNITQLFTTFAKNCSINETFQDGKTFGDRLGEILTTHVRIIDNYKRVVIGTDLKDVSYDAFVSANINAEMTADYAPKVVQSCMGESSFKAVTEKISKLGNIGGLIKSGMKDWQDATDLLLGKLSDKKAKEIERKLLAKELARQGVGGSQAKRILKNLDDFNGNPSIGTVGIGGFVWDIKKAWDDIANIFSETLKDIDTAWQNANELTKRFNKQEQAKALKGDLGKEISEMYATSKAIIGTQASASDDITAQLINAHMSLKGAKEQLKNTSKSATEACNSTKAGEGVCKPSTNN